MSLGALNVRLARIELRSAGRTHQVQVTDGQHPTITGVCRLIVAPLAQRQVNASVKRCQYGGSSQSSVVAGGLLDHPEAALLAPVVVNRLRRLREKRTGRRVSLAGLRAE